MEILITLYFSRLYEKLKDISKSITSCIPVPPKPAISLHAGMYGKFLKHKTDKLSSHMCMKEPKIRKTNPAIIRKLSDTNTTFIAPYSLIILTKLLLNIFIWAMVYQRHAKIKDCLLFLSFGVIERI